MRNAIREKIKSICSYCGVGCGVEVEKLADGGLRLTGDAAHPVNRGLLCSKGRYLHYTVMDRSERLLYPEMRMERAAPRERVSWNHAIRRAAAVFSDTIRRHGPRSVGMYVSGQMLTEEYYLANKLVKGFWGSNNIDTNSRLCMSTAAAAYKTALGDDLVPINYEDIDHADCLMIAGANPAWCHPILFRRIERRKRERPATRIIVVDPRRTESCEIADLHLQIQPGTDALLFHAIARLLIENDAIDRGFIESHTEGFDDLRERVMAVGGAEAARRCGIPLKQIRQAAQWIGDSPAFLSFWSMGLNQSRVGVNKNLALINLNLLTGQIGKPGAGPFSLTGQPNAMGGREVGGMATLLAAHHDLNNPAHRRKVAEFWGGAPIDPHPGLTATEMFDALEDGQLKAIWIICTNPAVSLPNPARVERALARAEFVVVQDISRRSDTTAHADLLLPAAGWLEKEGTMTNSERRVGYLPRLVDPPGEALADCEILCRLARAMGFGSAFDHANAAQIYDEYARLTRGTAVDVSGISHARLRAEGTLQWPCPSPNHPGTPRLFCDGRFATPTGRARLSDVPFDGFDSPHNPQYPLILTTGRVRDQWHTMTRTGGVGRLRGHASDPLVELHPRDAAEFGIAEGQPVEVSSPDGVIRTRAKLTDTLKPGVAFMPMHWGKQLNGGTARANNVVSRAKDPVSQEPDFKFTPVAVRPIVMPPRRIVVIGGGAASLEFVRHYRSLNRNDTLTVFAAEPHLFYNRILLPELIAGSRPWASLISLNDPQLRDLDVEYSSGLRIVAIHRAEKEIEGEDGRRYGYDQLVIATGSRPRVCPGIPSGMNGICTLRTRGDADRIIEAARDCEHAVVVGGGLLGIETAAALGALGIGVILLHRSSSLMRQQLDAIASAILMERLSDLDIEVILNDEIENVMGVNQVRRVRTRAGRLLPCELLVMAVGIEPNADLARQAELEIGRGIRVDARMATSDPAIYAIGETAEFEGQCCGTTPVVQAQARVAAAAIAGDPLARYAPMTESNILKVPGLKLAAIGESHLEPFDAADGCEVIHVLDRQAHYYKKCVIRHGRLVGAILIGDLAELPQWREWIQDGIELEERRAELLRSGQGSAAPVREGALVCSCHQVGRGNLEKFIKEGCESVEALSRASRAGTGCGSCIPELHRVWDECFSTAGIRQEVSVG